MSKFEERFPSLSKELSFRCDSRSTEYSGHRKKDIKKHCLDKKKVKEAIDKLAKETVEIGTHCPYHVASKLKHELGLEE